MFDFSIVLRTYNPDIRLIKRCLNAVQKLDSTGLTYELIVVDNNCTIPLKERPEITELLNEIKNHKLVLEPTPGSSNAGIKGVQNAEAPWIIFFDDDNEASPDYLQQLLSVIRKYPNVGIWGPGEVSVDFVDKTTDWIKQNCRDVFQEKKFTRTEYALQESWNRCYPPGTGFCFRKDIFDKYIELYYANQFRTLARVGNSLMSGEDTQIIYTSIALQLAVGTCPELKLNHLIAASKANFSYIKRLRFFTRHSIPLSNIEFYPKLTEQYKNQQRSQFSLFIQLNRYLMGGVLKNKIKESIIDCALIAGNYTGINLALNRKNPYWLLLFLKTIGIEIT